MKFSTSVISAISALASVAITASAFTTPKASFVATRVVSHSQNGISHAAACPCPSCTSASHAAGCSCLACGMKTILRMSTTEDEQVPAEVEALDGVVSDEEVHNKERPARESGIKKHRKGEKKGTPLAELEVGSYVDGTVKAVTSYGAFVDIGAATDALLHVSRLSNSFVSNVEDVVKSGDSVNVRIVSVDVGKGQVAISMLSEDDENAAKAARGGGGRRKERPKRSGADRSSQVETINALAEAGFDDNKMVEGEVVSTLDFGAFVRFDASQLADSVQGELDGLVHISALTAGRADSVASVVSVGDKVQIRVKSLDTAGNKVSLSMISKEAEEVPSRPQRKTDDAKPQRSGRQMFSDSEMGAKDWKDSLQKFQDVNSDFTNMPVIVDKRKTTA